MASSTNRRGTGRKKTGFIYINPEKKRPSQYEEITLHTQWDPRNFASAGWFNRDKNGQPPWREDASLLRATDWWAYRDPNAEWFRPFVKRQADVGRAIEQSIASAKRSDSFRTFDQSWVKFLENHYAAYRFAEYGLFLALCQAQREAGSDVVAQPIVFQSVEKDRHAQDITLYCMELETAIDNFSDANAKASWMEAPEWQGLRRITEYLLACRDWGEIYVVINCLLEPLVSTLFCRELVLRHAPIHGDSVTTTLVQGAEADRAGRYDSMKAFVTMTIDQNAKNREVIQDWLDKWRPLAEQAAKDILPLFSTLKYQAVHPDEAYQRCLANLEDLLSEFDITVTGEAAA